MADQNTEVPTNPLDRAINYGRDVPEPPRLPSAPQNQDSLSQRFQQPISPDQPNQGKPPFGTGKITSEPISNPEPKPGYEGDKAP